MNPLPRVTRETLDEFLSEINREDYFTSVMESLEAENEKFFTYLMRYHVDSGDTSYMTAALLTYDLLKRQMQKESVEMPVVSEGTLENVIEVITTRKSTKDEATKQVREENPIVYNTVTNVTEDLTGMIIAYSLLRSQTLSDRLKEELAHGT